ncbi:uncharacterized protein HMPREF1120_07967 [Exophiala dermatitidis NIH/UT8656]|uniref:Ig-like domain-containing protein n=1 Tax=Exophiala dermatitidis (strain ATCC 34100 / CBS 525.76 / NIH/UT8656) TaxID=858893 RepID=H6CA28_EXODN|nr:uncharacterized protein HMPREF1120_07967 [Exophiala dermatitidis NIH/UT8656]EHY59992.1 hypothetical protein HMPREF1120_07967 [Exophiala dermatitidis NIH/UT8656]
MSGTRPSAALLLCLYLFFVTPPSLAEGPSQILPTTDRPAPGPSGQASAECRLLNLQAGGCPRHSRLTLSWLCRVHLISRQGERSWLHDTKPAISERQRPKGSRCLQQHRHTELWAFTIDAGWPYSPQFDLQAA